MANMQVFPGANARTTININGRVYSAQVGGAPIIAPDFDAFVLLSNGWLSSAANGAGTTTQRPSTPTKGYEFFDTVVGAAIIWNGKNWINHASGAIA